MPNTFDPAAIAVATKKFVFAGRVYEAGDLFPHKTAGPRGKALPEIELRGLFLADWIDFVVDKDEVKKLKARHVESERARAELEAKRAEVEAQEAEELARVAQEKAAAAKARAAKAKQPRETAQAD